MNKTFVQSFSILLLCKKNCAKLLAMLATPIFYSTILYILLNFVNNIGTSWFADGASLRVSGSTLAGQSVSEWPGLPRSRWPLRSPGPVSAAADRAECAGYFQRSMYNSVGRLLRQSQLLTFHFALYASFSIDFWNGLCRCQSWCSAGAEVTRLRLP